MRSRRNATTLLPLLITAVACGPTYDYEADATAIEAVREVEGSAMATGDLDAMIGLLTPDAILMPPNQPPVSGTNAIREWAEDFVAAMEIVIRSYETEDVKVSGDLAVERYAGEWVLTPVAGGDAVTEVVKGIHVLERQADGTWKIVYDVWNADTPLPGM